MPPTPKQILAAMGGGGAYTPAWSPTPLPNSDPGMAPQTNGTDMAKIFGMMQQGQLQQSQQRQAAAREFMNPTVRGTSGGIIDPTSGVEAGNPFGGFHFAGFDERVAKENEMLGHPGIEGARADARSFNSQPATADPTGSVFVGKTGVDPNTNTGGFIAPATLNATPMFGGQLQRNVLPPNPYGTGSSVSVGPQGSAATLAAWNQAQQNRSYQQPTGLSFAQK